MRIEGDVRVIWRDDRVLPAELAAVDALKLRIWNVGFKRFEDLANLPNLVELTVLDWKAPSFEPLRNLVRLRTLAISHFPQVDSFAPLAGLTNLESLTLQTLPSWDASRKRQHVDSFAPLAGLTRLRTLNLSGVLAEDGELSYLGGLVRLELLAIGNMYTQEQFARLAARIPGASSSFLAPYLEAEWSVCKKCGAAKVMLSGSDVPNPKVICPSCNHKKFDTTVARFEELRAAS
ncbi:MAG: hypothetical protein U0360_09510 [Dehalococcoidia bacterium]